MPEIGYRLTPSEAAALDKSVPADVVLVWGTDWDGNFTPRALRKGYGAALIGELGKRFDVRGPEALLCAECDDVLFVPAAGQMTLRYQQHLSRAHGISAPLLSH